jgi:hypothetical protein
METLGIAAFRQGLMPTTTTSVVECLIGEVRVAVSRVCVSGAAVRTIRAITAPLCWLSCSEFLLSAESFLSSSQPFGAGSRA